MTTFVDLIRVSRTQIADAEQKQMLMVLSAILHIGNLEFQFNAQLKRHVVRDRELLGKVAHLLSLNVNAHMHTKSLSNDVWFR